MQGRSLAAASTHVRTLSNLHILRDRVGRRLGPWKLVGEKNDRESRKRPVHLRFGR